MRILIIIDETSFYHPLFFFDLYKKLKSKKYSVHVGLVTKINNKNSIENYMLRNLSKLYFKEIVLLSAKKIFFYLSRNLLINFNIFFNVKSILRKFAIDFFEIKYTINKKIYINKVKKIKPDLIISSCSVIFPKKILDIPKHGCINRHTSLLPSYGGIYPVFQSIADGKKFSGVTIHLMSKKIDVGKILAQKKIYNYENNLSKIYKTAFLISPNLIIKAIDNLLIKKKYYKNNFKKSYFSFPNELRWDKFRKNNGKFI